MDRSLTDLYARDGHVSTLTHDRYAHGELPGPAARSVADHLATCERCRSRHAWIDSVRLAPPLPPELGAGPSSGTAWLVGGGIAALAAALILTVLPTPERAIQVDNEVLPSVSQYTTGSPVDAGGDGLQLEITPTEVGLSVLATPGEVGMLGIWALTDRGMDMGGTGGQYGIEAVTLESGVDVRVDQRVEGETPVAGPGSVVVAVLCDTEPAFEAAAGEVAAGHVPEPRPGCVIERRHVE